MGTDERGKRPIAAADAGARVAPSLERPLPELQRDAGPG